MNAHAQTPVFYDGKLRTVPSERRATKRPPIVAGEPADGAVGAVNLLERSMSFHQMKDAPYESRRNVGEARYVAHVLRSLLAKNTGLTLGVVAFSEAQQGQIEQAIRELGEEDPEFRARVEAEMDREEEGQHVGLFVKNLENVRGDERDVVIISVCYGPDARAHADELRSHQQVLFPAEVRVGDLTLLREGFGRVPGL